MKSFALSLVIFALIGTVVITDATWVYRRPHCGHKPCRPRPIWKPQPVWRPRPPVILPPAATAPPVTTTTTTPAFDAGFNCQGLEDGIYDLGCSEYFVTCLNGISTYTKCPADLVFDSITARCLERPYVTACGGVATPIPTEPPTPAYAPPEVTVLPETTFPYVQPCWRRPSGVYGYGCSKDFVFCSGGHPSWMHCPEPMRFNPVTHKCTPSGSISTCRRGVHYPIHPHINIGEAYRK